MRSKMNPSEQKLCPHSNKKVFSTGGKGCESGEMSKNNYGGCFYTVGFRVNQVVHLTGLVFFGPAEKEIADYRVKIKICYTEQIWNRFNRILGCFGSGPYFRTIDILPTYTLDVVGCKKGENFLIPLPSPVHISPNIWTDIKFELIGPDTQCLKYGRHAFSGHDACSIVDSSKVHFEFLEGSRQLSSLKYFQG